MLILFLFFFFTFFLGADEAFTVACSPTDASLVASGGKDDRGFLWRIGSAEGALELTGMVSLLSFWYVGSVTHWNLYCSSDICARLHFVFLWRKHSLFIWIHVTFMFSSFVIVYSEHYMKLSFVLGHFSSDHTCMVCVFDIHFPHGCNLFG